MSKDVILGIESSCDDTAAAVVDRDGNVLSSIIASQTHIHSHWGGVYPEFASRAHALTVIPTIERALAEANVKGPDLKAIGVTRGPGSDRFADRRRQHCRRTGLRLERSGARDQSPARTSAQRRPGGATSRAAGDRVARFWWSYIPGAHGEFDFDSIARLDERRFSG